MYHSVIVADAWGYVKSRKYIGRDKAVAEDALLAEMNSQSSKGMTVLIARDGGGYTLQDADRRFAGRLYIETRR